jgi:hypothetical protein
MSGSKLRKYPYQLHLLQFNHWVDFGQHQIAYPLISPASETKNDGELGTKKLQTSSRKAFSQKISQLIIGTNKSNK